MNVVAVCFSDGCMLKLFEVYRGEITRDRAITRARRVHQLIGPPCGVFDILRYAKETGDTLQLC
jgi:hypothetical protein